MFVEVRSQTLAYFHCKIRHFYSRSLCSVLSERSDCAPKRIWRATIASRASYRELYDALCTRAASGVHPRSSNALSFINISPIVG